MRRLGPELKMPDLKALKVPGFLVDLYWDLRDRHLLPLLGLLLAAIVAVPFLLGGDSEDPSFSEVQKIAEEAATAEASGAGPARLSVVEAKPGLRDYRKRLGGRTPTDPFEQRLTAPQVAGADLPEAKEASSSSGGGGESSETTVKAETKGGSVTVTETGEPGKESPDGSVSPPSGGDGNGITVYRFTVDARIVRTEVDANGVRKTGEPTTRREVVPGTPLPGAKAPAVTYLGLGAKGRKALLLISPDVSAIYGDGECTSGLEACQVIEVEPGFPQTFVYGPNEARYKITVLKIEAIPVGSL